MTLERSTSNKARTYSSVLGVIIVEEELNATTLTILKKTQYIISIIGIE